MTPEIAREFKRHLDGGHYRWHYVQPQLGACRFCPTWQEMRREQRIAYARRRFHFGRG
jgi:hypothetical protein